VAAHSEGGGVEVNSGNAIMCKSLRERTAAAHSEAGSRWRHALGPGQGDGMLWGRDRGRQVVEAVVA
jgi:hypothetical protein